MKDIDKGYYAGAVIGLSIGIIIGIGVGGYLVSEKNTVKTTPITANHNYTIKDSIVESVGMPIYFNGNLSEFYTKCFELQDGWFEYNFVDEIATCRVDSIKMMVGNYTIDEYDDLHSKSSVSEEKEN